MSPKPALILLTAIEIASKPEAQYLLIVTPGTSFPRALAEINLATCRPCSPSGLAQPTITSSTLVVSSSGTCEARCLITSTAKSSVL